MRSEARRVTAAWLPMTLPTVRTTVFIPVATPVSVGRTASVMSFGMAANATATPAEATANQNMSCHGAACQMARPGAADGDDHEPADQREPRSDAPFEDARRRSGPSGIDEGPSRSVG
jgi:hypothetical protein